MVPSQVAQQLDVILDQLVKSVEGAVHAFYRGEHKQNTSQVRSDQFRKVARESLMSLLGGSMTPRAGVTLGALGGGSAGNAALLEADEIAAITRCIMGWLPMGAPNAASPQSRCVPAAKELSPSWGEREKARTSLKRAAG
ncbi:MAG: hypothetical protein ACJ796_11045 [Gemmatimonadaceae bacterium]